MLFFLCTLYAAPVLMEPEMVCDGGFPIVINEYENPCPISADWDGDGLTDLIIGVAQSETRSDCTRYRYYRNLSSGGDPVFDGWEYLLTMDGTPLTTGLNNSNN
ncbi:MAG: hypothetical protein KAH54_11895 [Candidatus Sabulitectum sp.]|nr:hypothetical protein [Candidatus Sabulitectum sp.]